MAKTLYEGYRVGKNGGERWVGTVQRDADTRNDAAAVQKLPVSPAKNQKTPKGGSVIRMSPDTSKKK